jgi:hypothetical protein
LLTPPMIMLAPSAANATMCAVMKSVTTHSIVRITGGMFLLS